LETTSAITRALGTETDLDRVLELIVKRGRALVEATSMVLLLAEGGELVGRAVAGEVGASVLGLKVPVEDSVVGHVCSGRDARNGSPRRGARCDSASASTCTPRPA
jgi:hypothetical protein